MTGPSPPNDASPIQRASPAIGLSWAGLLSMLAFAVLVGTWALSDRRTWSLIENTLLLVAGTLAISLPIGTALAVLLFRTDAPGRRTVAVLLGIMLIVPLYLHAAAWEAGFGPSGWFTVLAGNPYQAELLSGWRGAVWVHALAALPWVVLIVGLAVRWVEPELEEAALLDGNVWQVLTRVTLRRALLAIGLAAVWIALSVATEMTVADLFQTGTTRLRTYAEEIYTQSNLGPEPGRVPLSSWIGVVVSGSLTACALLLCLAAARWRAAPTDRPPLVYRLGRWRPVALLLLLMVAAIVVGVPLINLVTKAGLMAEKTPEGFVRSWSPGHAIEIIVGSPERYRREIGSSALIAALAASVVLLAALPLGWLARRSRLAGAAALALAALALAIPGPLLGVSLIEVFNRPGATWLNFLYDRTVAATVVAQAVRAFPVGMLIVWHALDSLPSELLEAAELDGAGPWRRILLVALPLRWPGLVLAWLAAFVVAIGELSATILVVPPGVETLGVRISQLLHFNMQDKLAGLCLVLMLAAAALAALLLAFAAWAARRNGAGSTRISQDS